MRGFLTGLILIGVVLVILTAFGWIYFFSDDGRVGIGVNEEEVRSESGEIIDSAQDAASRVGGAVRDIEGRDTRAVNESAFD